MSKVRYGELIKELHEGLNEATSEMPEVDPSEFATEVASTIIYDEKWITPYLQSRNVTDIQGRLADDIYSGRI